MKKYKGSCHCGNIQFTVTTNLDSVRVCDCSICAMRSALNHRVPAHHLELQTPLEKLSIYKWGSETARDYFCPTCGILPFRKPGAPTPQEIRDGVQTFDGYAVNVRCLQGVDHSKLPIQKIKSKKLSYES